MWRERQSSRRDPFVVLAATVEGVAVFVGSYGLALLAPRDRVHRAGRVNPGREQKFKAPFGPRRRKEMLPLQVIDSFLLNYNIGQVLLLVFALGTLGLLGLGSKKVLSLHFGTFGLIFVMTPQAINSKIYLFLGLALIVIAPMLFATADE